MFKKVKNDFLHHFKNVNSLFGRLLSRQQLTDLTFVVSLLYLFSDYTAKHENTLTIAFVEKDKKNQEKVKVQNRW